jgi:hypothetical protein
VIARARLVLLVAFVVGVVIVATEFPFRQLLDERATVTRSGQQLSKLQTANESLQSVVDSLHQPSSIAGVAHSEYGLVQPGQRAVVVLPGGGTGGSGPLSSKRIPNSDIVPTDSIVSSAGNNAGTRGSSGFWSQLLKRLEFWKASQ